MKKKSKIVMIVLLLLMTILFGTPIVNAVATGGGAGETSSTQTQQEGIDKVISTGKNFISAGDSEVVNENNLKSVSNDVVKLLTTIGMIASVGVFMILGIKYMLGAAEAQAEVKKTMIPFLVGCIVIFGAFAIWNAAVTILQSAA